MRWPRISIRSAPNRAETRLVLVLVALLVTSCRGRERHVAAQDPAIATIAAERAGLSEPGVRGKILYGIYCAVCHGDTGAGDGFNASNIGVPPADLRGLVAARGEAMVSKVVREGSSAIGKSPLCPPYGHLLDDADRQLIVAYLREGLKAPADTTTTAH